MGELIRNALLTHDVSWAVLIKPDLLIPVYCDSTQHHFTDNIQSDFSGRNNQFADTTNAFPFI